MRQIIYISLLSCLLCGCSIPINGQNGTTHHLIVGLGVVTVKQPNENNGVLVTKTESIGAQISDQPTIHFAIGYSKSNVVSIPETTNNIVLEISQKTLGPINIVINPTITGETINEKSKQ
ncbi:MAG: hypothetical protein KKC46_01940 [Proteobacteria bacterium]|nr:hypothetical protein [Pseudomonadota bacterium]